MVKVLHYNLDFGTSNTLLGAVTEFGRVKSIPLDFNNEENPHVIKSLIYTPSEFEWYFGSECYSKYLEREGEGRFFRSFKTLLSRESFEGTMIHGKKVDVVSLVARFLREVRHRANSFYQQDVKRVVCGRPVRFGDTEKSDELALKRLTTALKLAGFEEVEFIYEPVTAAVDLDLNFEEEKNVLIADIGGGTSDFSVIKMNKSGFKSEDILSVGGINIAGDNFDFALMKDFIMPELGSRVRYKRPGSNIDHGLSKTLLHKLCTPSIFSLINDSQIQDYIEEMEDFIEGSDLEKIKNLENLFEEKLGFDLMKEVEKKKINLSEVSSESLDYSKKGIKIKKSLQRSDYEKSCEETIKKIIDTMNKVINNSGVKVDLIIPVGGGVKNPLILNLLTSS